MSEPAKIAHQPPGVVFPWPKSWKLTALDEAILVIPSAILSNDEVIGSVIHCDDEVRLNLPTGHESESDALMLIKLKEGQSVFLSKSCQAMILPNYEGDKAKKCFTFTYVGV